MSLFAPAIIWTGLVTVLACLVYFYTGINVGRMRGRHKIDAPTMVGHPEFERAVRVQMNTLEWLPIFLAFLWLAALYYGTYIVPAIGVVWVIGRVLYMTGYMTEAGKRSLGFMVQTLASLALLVLALFGMVSGLMI